MDFGPESGLDPTIKPDLDPSISNNHIRILIFFPGIICDFSSFPQTAIFANKIRANNFGRQYRKPCSDDTANFLSYNDPRKTSSVYGIDIESWSYSTENTGCRI